MNKLSKIFLGIIIALVVLLVIVWFIFFNKEEQTYDISFMKEVSVSEALDLFESENYHVIFVGREKCFVCEKMLPALKKAQIEYNFVSLYIDITKVDRLSSEWQEFINKLTMKSTQTLGETDEGEKVTESYGYFLDEYGFTPTVIVSKSGKQEAGCIGYKSEEELFNFIKSKGID